MAKLYFPHKPQTLYAPLKGVIPDRHLARMIALEEDNQRAVEDVSNSGPAEILVAVVQYTGTNLPAVIYTEVLTDWKAASEPARSEQGTEAWVEGTPGAWTGDKFQVWIGPNTPGHSTLLQSSDGKTWSWHPDATTFSQSVQVYGIAANGSGLVAAVLSPGNSLVISTDFGTTWTTATLPGSASVENVAIQGSTIVAFDSSTGAPGPSSVFSINQGATWTPITWDPSMVTWSVYDVLPHGGFWYFALYSGGTDGPIWKTDDFSTWTRVLTPYDADWPHSLTYFGPGVTEGTIYHLFAGGPDGQTLLGLGTPGTFSDGEILASLDAGATWRVISTTDDNWGSTVLEDDIISALDPNWSLGLDRGAAYALGHWWICNDEYPPGATNPPFLFGTADLETWVASYPSTALTGDGVSDYVSAYSTLMTRITPDVGTA